MDDHLVLEAARRASSKASYIKSDVVDMTKIILIQRRLASCYQRNDTDAALTKCLEQEYLRSRHSLIKEAAEKFKRIGGQPPKSPSTHSFKDLDEMTNHGLAKQYHHRADTKVNHFPYPKQQAAEAFNLIEGQSPSSPTHSFKDADEMSNRGLTEQYYDRPGTKVKPFPSLMQKAAEAFKRIGGQQPNFPTHSFKDTNEITSITNIGMPKPSYHRQAIGANPFLYSLQMAAEKSKLIGGQSPNSLAQSVKDSDEITYIGLTKPSFHLQDIGGNHFPYPIQDLDEMSSQGLAKQYYRRRATKVNPFLHHIVARPQNGCDVATYVIILVHSFHPYGDRRNAIRKTWGSVATGGAWPKEELTKKVRLLFVLGTHVQREYNDVIMSELNQHNDIIQGDFVDDYKNLTLKSLLGLKYVIEACPSTPFLLKSDDDMIINIPYLLDILQSKTYVRSILGPINAGSKPRRVGKWSVSRQQFPFSRYPVYESGAAYVITGDLIRDLFETSEYVPTLPVEDVYITGVLGRVLNVSHVEQEGFAYWVDKITTACDIIRRRKITGTKMTPGRLTDLWRMISTAAC